MTSTTTLTCDACGKSKDFEKEWPSGWRYLTLQYEIWYPKSRTKATRIDAHYCPDCAALLPETIDATTFVQVS